MQGTIVVLFFMLAISQLGDALKCYENTNAKSNKTLVECPSFLPNARCLGGKMGISMSLGGHKLKMDRELSMCTIEAACTSMCKMTEHQLKNSMPSIKITSCKTFCCDSDGCN
ncbi:uncharacterized protein LOC130630460 [Hydractinia symbiolongicarpus]|uniref:uncharacterized protein LOC130630460 n=1 Tax=Hydractinia symbiolongicarpus TaxID=13093 RepID=UPI00254BF056|nr:uncharacterized protein LOC130630460 [Hydractinia symbiolongicarpus]